MTEIIDAIDSWAGPYLDTITSPSNNTLFGHCELMKKTAKDSVQVMPVTIDGRVQVSLDDKKNIITWIRITDPVAVSLLEGDTWGIVEQRNQSLQLRVVVAHKTSLGDLIYDFANNFPDYLTITGFEKVFPTVNEVLTDHEAIYTEELGDTVYEKHRFTWNIYALNVSVDFIKCE